MIAWRWVAGGRAAPSGSSRWCHILALTCPGQAPHNSVVHPAARAKDRWHQLADAIRHSNLPASDKSVYGCLLAKTDYKTALLPPRFTPARQKIAREASISTRRVRYAIRHLERHHWITVTGTTGPGKTLSYTLSIGDRCNCNGRVHDQRARAREIPGHSERRQRETVTAATFGHRTAATPQARQRAGQEAPRGSRKRKPVAVKHGRQSATTLQKR